MGGRGTLALAATRNVETDYFPMSEPDQHHASPQNAPEWRAELSGRVTVVETGLNELKATTAAIGQSLKDLGSGVERLALDIRAERKPTQWGVLLSLLALVVAVGGGFTTLTVQPLKDSISSLDNRVASLREQSFDTAYFRGAAEERDKALDRQLDSVSLHIQEAESENLKRATDAAYTRGHMEALKRWVQSVDNYGSRRWVDGSESRSSTSDTLAE